MTSGLDKGVYRVELRLIRDADFLQNRQKLLTETAACVLRLPHIDDSEAVLALPGDEDEQALDPMSLR